MFAKLRRQTATLTDERIRIMHEIINGVKVQCCQMAIAGF